MTMPIFAPGSAAAAALLGGLAFGCAYFAVLRRTVDLYTAGRGLLVPALLTAGRLATAILFLGVAAKIGALPLLLAFLGFLVARTLVFLSARGAA
jgi:F1-F0 ATPase (N-ATPase) AtpR subunit